MAFDFDSIPISKIHQIERMGDDMHLINKSICDYLFITDRLDNERMVNELFVELNEYSNPYALKKIAELYRDGIYFTQSDEMYILKIEDFFQNLCSINRYGAEVCCISFYDTARVLYESNYSGLELYYLSTDEWRVLCEIGEAGQILGDYYSGFYDVDHLKKALFYYETALWCHFNVKDEINSIIERINCIEKECGMQENSGVYRTCVDNYKTDENNSLSLDTQTIKNLEELFASSKLQLVNSFGSQWGKLAEQTRAHLITALFTFAQYAGCRNIKRAELDYSGVTSLLMRALEYELDIFFHKGYLQYLCSKLLSPIDFLAQNGLKENKWDHRKLIVYKENGEIRYVQPEMIHFSLGRLEQLIGYKRSVNILEISMDQTFYEYCKISTDMNPDDLSFKLWISGIINSVDQLRNIRNKASHGGSVLHIEEAKDAFNTIIWVKKIIMLLMEHKTMEQ